MTLDAPVGAYCPSCDSEDCRCTNASDLNSQPSNNGTGFHDLFTLTKLFTHRHALGGAAYHGVAGEIALTIAQGVRISRMKSSEHVDAVVALAMALEALERRPAKRPSVYETRGVELL